MGMRRIPVSEKYRGIRSDGTVLYTVGLLNTAVYWQRQNNDIWCGLHYIRVI